MRSHFLKAALILCSMSFAIITTDLYIFYTYKLPNHREDYIQNLIKSKISHDNRNIIELMTDIEKEGKKAWPFISFVHRYSPLKNDHDGVFPLGSISHSETLLCNESGYWASYVTDRYGFPNPDSVWDKENSGVMILGDSFGVSSCMSRDKAFDSYIRKSFPNTKIVAARGANLEWHLAALKEYGKIAKPQKIIILLFSNDVPGETFNHHPVFSRYLDPDYTQDLINRQTEIDDLWKDVLTKERKKATHTTSNQKSTKPFVIKDVLLLRHLRSALHWTLSRDATNYDALKTLLQEMEHEVNTWNGKILYVYLPSYSEIRTQDPISANRLKTWFAKQGLPFVDISPEFYTNSTNELFDFPGSHFNQLGYKILGEKLNSLLQQFSEIQDESTQ